MKRKKALLYDPYLDVMGGGEKHILSVLQVLENVGYEVNIAWDKDLTDELKQKLNIEFKSLHFVQNVFQGKSILQSVTNLHNIDVFLYVTDGSYFFSHAKNNYVFSMYPKKELYNLTFLNRLKLWNYKFISNSHFTHDRLKSFGISSKVIYPYIDSVFLNQDLKILRKDKTILNVGRFFRQLHAKRQDVAIDMFIALMERLPELKDYFLILAGGVKDKDDKLYLDELQKKAQEYPNIIFKPNIPFSELLGLYQHASYYWHFAGFGIDENKEPDKVEHLGITPLEAMACGAITFCYAVGGPKEIIDSGKNGFLFTSQNQLLDEMKKVIFSEKLQDEIKISAQKYIQDTFSYQHFEKEVKETIL